MTMARLMAGAALIALIAHPALAQSPGTASPQQQQPPAAAGQQQPAQQDLEFAKKAAGDGMAEVKLGQLASQQAESAQVKQFGQRMVDDHSSANDKLRSIARQEGIDLPQGMRDQAQQAYNDLQSKSGHGFDQAYMDKMVEDHQKAVDLFQQEAQSGEDADLQSFAEQTLPTLQEHLDLAQKAQTQVTSAVERGPARTSQQAAAEPAAGQPPTGEQVLAKDVIGAEVVNTKGEQVGTVKDLVIDQDRIEYVVVAVGGFLGFGEKEVAIPLDRLKFGKDKSYLMSAESEDQLKQMPEYQKDQYQPLG
jgi:putative membrane protein